MAPEPEPDPSPRPDMAPPAHPGDPAPWRTLASRYVHHCPWLKARQDHVRLENGAEMEDYYVLEYPDWVNAVLVTPEQEAVLIRIYRHGIRAVHFEVPGGVIDPGEDPLAAARREAMEETGYGAETWRSLGRVSANSATHDNATWLFLGLDARRIREPDPDEAEELVTHRVPLREVAELLAGEEVFQATHALALTRACLALGVSASTGEWRLGDTGSATGEAAGEATGDRP